MKNLLFLLAVSLIFICCNNDDNNQPTDPIDQLPPATQTGENTFGCLVNGEVMIPNNSMYMSAIYQGGGVQISGEINKNGISQSILITVLEPFTINQTYSLINKSRFIKYSEENTCYYDFEHCYEGHVKFTKIDQVNYIISGTFEFSTVNDECEVVHITNGRFDMQYIP